MRRLLAAALLALFLVGCHAPTPSMNVLAPYGSPTVPPPQTGAVGTSGDYYAAPTPPPAAPTGNLGVPPAALSPGATGGYGTQLQPGTAPGAFMGTSNEPTTVIDSAVVPASYTPGTTTGTSLSSPASSSPSTLKLNGMRVNDATSATAPQPTPAGAPVNLTSLPDATQTPSFMRMLTPSGSSANNTPTPAAPATASNAAWQTR